MKYLFFFFGKLGTGGKIYHFWFLSFTSMSLNCAILSGMGELRSGGQPYSTDIGISLWNKGMRVSVTQNPFHLLPGPTNSPCTALCPNLPSWFCWGFPASLLGTGNCTLSPRVSYFSLKEVAEPTIIINLKITNQPTDYLCVLSALLASFRDGLPSSITSGKRGKAGI